MIALFQTTPGLGIWLVQQPINHLKTRDMKGKGWNASVFFKQNLQHALASHASASMPNSCCAQARFKTSWNWNFPRMLRLDLADADKPPLIWQFIHLAIHPLRHRNRIWSRRFIGWCLQAPVSMLARMSLHSSVLVKTDHARCDLCAADACVDW